MGLATAITLLIFSWLAVATAMLWGVLRIARRHHHPHTEPRPTPLRKPPARPANAH